MSYVCYFKYNDDGIIKESVKLFGTMEEAIEYQKNEILRIFEDGYYMKYDDQIEDEEFEKIRKRNDNWSIITDKIKDLAKNKILRRLENSTRVKFVSRYGRVYTSICQVKIDNNNNN